MKNRSDRIEKAVKEDVKLTSQVFGLLSILHRKLKNVPPAINRYGCFGCGTCSQPLYQKDFDPKLSRRAKMGHIIGFCSESCMKAERTSHEKMLKSNKELFLLKLAGRPPRIPK